MTTCTGASRVNAVSCFSPGHFRRRTSRPVSYYALFFALFLAPAPLGARPFSRGRIVVHPGGRYLQYADGRPFFYLGDTAWELFHRTTREEARRFIHRRF